MVIVVEVLQHESKHWLQLYRLPSVDIICVEELRNGLLAHSCLHPGLTTMMINFVRTVTTLAEDDDYKERADREAWLHDYSYGASHQLYGIDISCFEGIVFSVLVDHFRRRSHSHSHL